MTKEEFITIITDSGFYAPNDSETLDHGWYPDPHKERYFYDFPQSEEFFVVEINYDRPILEYYINCFTTVTSSRLFDTYDEAWRYIND